MELKFLVICFFLLLIPKEGSSATITIHVHIIGTSKVILLEVEQSDMVETVKTFIEDKEGIPMRNQWLFKGGRPILNYRTLADYNIQNNEVLWLVTH